MCGIAGILNLDRSPVDAKVLESMVAIQRHRGPDDQGFFIGGTAGLGHARLSIIDLSHDAHQPMSNEDSSMVIVHNGEIYNYVELREELEARRHIFRSKSDTEVILHAYEEWGSDCLSRFNGMWAFAVLDLRKRSLFCARDRFGVKPFYYYLDGGVFVFASEIKALLAHPNVRRQPNERAVFNYLASGYGYMDISEETFFAGIRQLRQAHYAEVSLEDGGFKEVQYWDLDPRNRARVSGDDDACDRFFRLLEDAVRLRLRSDVPVGVSLSGGLDSSSVACIAAGLLRPRAMETFSSCFDEPEYDERKFIMPVLEKTGARPNLIFSKPDNLFKELEEILWHQDEPYSTLSIFPQWHVMKLAREKLVKVLLTGQGGDEVLGGYHKYYYYLFADLIGSLRWRQARKEVSSYSASNGPDRAVAAQVLKIVASSATPRPIKDMARRLRSNRIPDYLDKEFAASSANAAPHEKRFGSILNNDLYNALRVSPLPSLLHIDDRSSMAHSVESRAPFLDYRLVEYLFSLGPEFKIRDGMTKYLLRRSMKGVLPEAVRTRRDKMGFATPLEKWFRADLKELVRDILSSDSFRKRPYFDRSKVEARLDDYMNGAGGGVHFTIWSWVSLELWLRKFIDRKAAYAL